MITARAAMRKKSKKIGEQIQLEVKAMCFNAIMQMHNKSYTYVAEGKQGPGTMTVKMQQLRYRKALMDLDVAKCGNVIDRKCDKDLAEYIEAKAGEVVEAVEKDTKRNLYKKVKWFTTTTAPAKALVANSEGEPARDKQEEAANIKAHFRTVMKGRNSTFEAHVKEQRQKMEQTRSQREAIERSCDAIVGKVDTMMKLHKVKRDKAHGPGLLNSTVTKVLARPLARLYDPLTVKAYVNITPPIQWKGKGVM